MHRLGIETNILSQGLTPSPVGFNTCCRSNRASDKKNINQGQSPTRAYVKNYSWGFTPSRVGVTI